MCSFCFEGLIHLTVSKFSLSFFFLRESACPCGFVLAVCSAPVSEKLSSSLGQPSSYGCVESSTVTYIVISLSNWAAFLKIFRFVGLMDSYTFVNTISGGGEDSDICLAKEIPPVTLLNFSENEERCLQGCNTV